VNNLLGVDIGGSHFRVGLFDQEGRRLLVSEAETDRSAGREWMLAQVLERCKSLLAQTDYPVKACGISFGGPVNFEEQCVTSVHVPGWKGFGLARWAGDNLKLPCRIDNDANAGALGEFRFGAGRGAKSLTYITLSTGIGCGLICEGKVYRGKDGLAGELGHIPVSDSGYPCSCGGKGCLETFCSGTAIGQRGREWGERRPERVARIVELSGGKVESITAGAVMQAAAEGDMAAAHIVREAARWLARGLLTLIRVFNPDKIVLGGGVMQSASVLLHPLRGFLDEFASPTIGYTTEIVVAELGTLSPLYGAGAMALDLLPQAP
jgi:glucokinase